MMAMSQMSGLYSKRKTCKPVCLFGVPDPVETEKIYEEALMRARENFLKRWNFDVFTEQPSTVVPEGPKWEKVVPRAEDERVVAEDTSRLTGVEEGLPSGTAPGAGSPRGQGVRHSPYDKQQKLKDFWRNRKATSISHNSRTSKTLEDLSDGATRTHSSQSGSSDL